MNVPQWVLGSILALASVSALAGAPKLSNMEVDGVLAYHDELAQVLRKRDYAHISMRDRLDIDRAQSMIRSRLEGHQSMAELTEQQRVDVFNAHERIVAIIEEAEADRMVCKRRRMPGTHTMTVVCDKAGDLERSRQRLAVEEIYRKNINRTGGM